MTRAEIIAYNAGVAMVAALAAASADALRLRLTVAPTRYAFAIEALDAIAEGSADLLLQLPPNGTAALPPKPLTPASGAAPQSSEDTRCKEASHGC